jgi:hypothetical protein
MKERKKERKKMEVWLSHHSPVSDQSDFLSLGADKSSQIWQHIRYPGHTWGMPI